MRRRDFLKGATAAGISIGLAGCSAPSGGSDYSAKDVRAPRIAHSGSGWELVNRRQEMVREFSLGPLSVETFQHTLFYEKMSLRERINEGTMGNFDQTIMLFFASVIDLSPSLDELPFGVGVDQILSRIESEVENQLKREMRNKGLSGISLETTGTMEIDTGEEASGRLYTAAYTFSDMSVSLPTGDEMTIEGDSMPIRGMFAVWHNGESALVGGGAWPTENFQQTVSEDLTDMITVSVDIDLGLTPQQYGAEIHSLITSIR